MEKKELKHKIATALNTFRSAIQQHADINIKREDGGWSVGEIVNHVLKGTNTNLGSTKKTERPYDKHAESIKAVFLDFSKKFVSAPDIEPDLKLYSKEELLLALEATERRVIDMIEREDLTETCIDWQLPVWGHLTKYECVILFENHITRHTRQVNEFKKITANIS